MLKDEIAVIGAGLAGETVGIEFQRRNYLTYLINGSVQDNKSLPDAKNLLVLEGYDGLSGERSLAYEALKRNRRILKKIAEIDKKIIICIASGGGSTGSGTLPYISEIAASNPDKIVVAVLLMPRPDEAIQKRLNAYNAAKELMEVEGLGAIIFVDNSAYDDLNKINMTLVNMLDAFFTDSSYSSGSNFDDSEKMKMLKDNGAFVLAMLSDKNAEGKHVTTQDMLSALTAKNIFLPINDDGVVNNIGIINQGKNKIDEHEIVKAIGTPENIFTGANGNVNIACASGMSYPIEYIQKLGKKGTNERRYTMKKNTNPVKLRDAISNKKLSVTSVKVFIDDIARDYPPDQFTEDLEFLCESGYMANMIDFKFEITSEGVAVDIGRMCPCDSYIVIKMSIADSEDHQKIREMLVDEPEESD